MSSEVEVKDDCQAHEGKCGNDGGGDHAAVVAVLLHHPLVPGGGQCAGVHRISVEREDVGLDGLPVGEVGL